jgi:ferrochelatase
MTQKIAVVLMNLGGPDKTESIKPFLFNFFMDKNIIGAPLPIRYFLAKFIASKRSKGEALEAYEQLGGKSPLLDNTYLQLQALERSLKKDYTGGDIKCFVCMRYWHPMADEVVKQVMDYNPDKVVLLPLYPQFSTATTYSSFQDWHKVTQKNKFNVDTVSLCCYPFEDGFINASADLINHQYQNISKQHPDTKIRVLFSAHGLPEVTVKRGDPYQWQCEESARKIAEVMGIDNLDWEICYQSRVGPLKWIGPSTEEALQKAASDNVGVLVYPHAFVSDHVETLVEIEEEYREMAEEFGVPLFSRVPTVMTHPKFIVGLKNQILDIIDKNGILSPIGSEPICPSNAKHCCQRRKPY